MKEIQRVRDFLKVWRDVRGEDDLICVTGAATPLLAGDLRTIVDDPERVAFSIEAEKKFALALEGDLDAVRWMIQTAADYHDSQESAADAMDVLESVEYHKKRRERLQAVAAALGEGG